jgi:hypothetical protein
MSQTQKLCHPIDSSFYVYISREPQKSIYKKTVDKTLEDFDIDDLIENLTWCRNNKFDTVYFSEDGIILSRNKTKEELDDEVATLDKKYKDWNEERRLAMVKLETMYQEYLQSREDAYNSFKQQIEG